MSRAGAGNRAEPQTGRNFWVQVGGIGVDCRARTVLQREGVGRDVGYLERAVAVRVTQHAVNRDYVSIGKSVSGRSQNGRTCVRGVSYTARGACVARRCDVASRRGGVVEKDFATGVDLQNPFVLEDVVRPRCGR